MSVVGVPHCLVERACLGLLGCGPSDGGALRANAGAPDIACGIGRDLAEIGGQTNPPGPRFGFQGDADVVVKADGNRCGHSEALCEPSDVSPAM